MKLTLTRLVMMEECHWLERDYEKGETVYRFSGPTYGCIGPQGVAVTDVPDIGPFFELPDDALSEASHGK